MIYIITYQKGLKKHTTYAKGFLQKIKTVKNLKKQGFLVANIEKFWNKKTKKLKGAKKYEKLQTSTF